MDIKDLKKERSKLERELAGKIAVAVKAFRERTGISIERIDVDMLEVTEIGDAQEEYIVGGVSCKIVF